MPLYDDSDGLPVEDDNEEMKEKLEDNEFEKLEPGTDDGGEKDDDETGSDTES